LFLVVGLSSIRYEGQPYSWRRKKTDVNASRQNKGKSRAVSFIDSDESFHNKIGPLGVTAACLAFHLRPLDTGFNFLGRRNV
jgi:hypothetical protein